MPGLVLESGYKNSDRVKMARWMNEWIDRPIDGQRYK